MSVGGGQWESSGGGVWGWQQGQGWEDVSSPVLAAFIGDGPGRGWALLLMLIGVEVAAVVALLRFRNPGLLRLEDDLPDVTPEDRLRQSTGDKAMSVSAAGESARALRVNHR